MVRLGRAFGTSFGKVLRPRIPPTTGAVGDAARLDRAGNGAETTGAKIQERWLHDILALGVIR